MLLEELFKDDNLELEMIEMLGKRLIWTIILRLEEIVDEETKLLDKSELLVYERGLGEKTDEHSIVLEVSVPLADELGLEERINEESTVLETSKLLADGLANSDRTLDEDEIDEGITGQLKYPKRKLTVARA